MTGPARLDAAASAELERRAVALVEQYGLFMPGLVRGFLRDIAAFLNWTILEERLENET